MKTVTEARLQKYVLSTKTALERVRQGSAEDLDWQKAAGMIVDMATRYYQDALYYRKKGDLVTAFAALNYAHGWIDCGVRIGILAADEKDHEFIMPR